MPQQSHFDAVIAETAAFEREIGDFANRIGDAQIGAELEAAAAAMSTQPARTQA